MTENEQVVISQKEEERSAGTKGGTNPGDRHHGSPHQCFVPAWKCLLKKEHCRKGDAR